MKFHNVIKRAFALLYCTFQATKKTTMQGSSVNPFRWAQLLLLYLLLTASSKPKVLQELQQASLLLSLLTFSNNGAATL